jgi:Fic family protein
MTWNWQQPDWPEFEYDSAALTALEEAFLLHSGELLGAFRHVGAEDQDALRIELISEEALKTSEIEGELLDRDSVQSSLRQQFGLSATTRRVPAGERGIAEMMVDLYGAFDSRLTHNRLFRWHEMVMAGHRNIHIVGGYRKHKEPMQVVSGRFDRPKVHFEAPPSTRVKSEMAALIAWFNLTGPKGSRPLPSLTRAGIAHLYLESIHPFEDGNGRIGRALSVKALAQSLGQPSLVALAHTIERDRKAYYQWLERSNKENEITLWLVYFAETILQAQRTTMKHVEFYIAKTKFYDRFRGKLKPRQEKVIARMFEEGVDAWKGGLSAEIYISITKASRATATRDLRVLVELGGLIRSGERRHTRYRLNIPGNGDRSQGATS